MDNAIEKINEAIKGISFGEVIIKIQDKKIVQIERLEKFRINADSKSREVKS